MQCLVKDVHFLPPLSHSCPLAPRLHRHVGVPAGASSASTAEAWPAWYANSWLVPTAVITLSVASSAGSKVWCLGERPLKGRVSTTLRTPSASTSETTVTLLASASPAQCSASEPQVPILRSCTPEALTTMVYGESAITAALSPTPNQAEAGPESRIVARPPAGAASRVRLKLTGASALPLQVGTVAEPERSAPGAHAAAAPAAELKVTAAPPLPSATSVQPAGRPGSEMDALVSCEGAKPTARAAS